MYGKWLETYFQTEHKTGFNPPCGIELSHPKQGWGPKSHKGTSSCLPVLPNTPYPKYCKWLSSINIAIDPIIPNIPYYPNKLIPLFLNFPLNSPSAFAVTINKSPIFLESTSFETSRTGPIIDWAFTLYSDRANKSKFPF